MNDFKWKHFRGKIIFGCARWYCKYGMSYRDLEEMMVERGVDEIYVKAAKRFLGKILRKMKEYEKPVTVDTDKAPSYDRAIRELKEEGLLNDQVFQRKVKYLNNRIEPDHGKLKRLIKPTLGFNSMKTAYATIKGFEVMRMF